MGLSAAMGLGIQTAEGCSIAMTAVEEIQDRQARCQPYLLRLRMLAREEGEPMLAAAEVNRATSAIIAEAWAASQAALADGNRHHPGGQTFLRVRLNRLTRAATEAIAAAAEGDVPRLRHYVRRFEAVTAAIWTAEHAVCTSAVARWTRTGNA
jgi:hypothetical protein